tara:strand:+ start:99 stop:545 length:447 start_codon:yes stop_codon:yes gene_type:complete
MGMLLSVYLSKSERAAGLFMSEKDEKTILVVDDEADLRECLAEEFVSLGYKVLEAENAVVALDIVAQNTVHLILSDIRMPGGDGISLLRGLNELKSKGDRPLVYLMTGFSDVSDDEAKALGAASVFRKPSDIDAIIEAINQYLTEHAS